MAAISGRIGLHVRSTLYYMKVGFGVTAASWSGSAKLPYIEPAVSAGMGDGLGMLSATQVNSAWPSLGGRRNEYQCKLGR